MIKNAFQIASPSLDAWYKLQSTGDSPVLYQNRATGDIVQQPPPNIAVHDDTTEEVLYTYGNIFDPSLTSTNDPKFAGSDLAVWRRAVDGVSMRTFYFNKSLNISSWIVPPGVWRDYNTFKHLFDKENIENDYGSAGILTSSDGDSNPMLYFIEKRGALLRKIKDCYDIIKEREKLDWLEKENKKKWKVKLVNVDDCIESAAYQENTNGTIQYYNPFLSPSGSSKGNEIGNTPGQGSSTSPIRRTRAVSMAAQGTNTPRSDENSVVFYQNLHGGIMYKNPYEDDSLDVKNQMLEMEFYSIHKALNVLVKPTTSHTSRNLMRKISSIGSLPVLLQAGILDDRLSDSTIWLTNKERLLRWISSLNLTRIMFKGEQKAFLRFPEYLTPVSFLAHKDEGWYRNKASGSIQRTSVQISAEIYLSYSCTSPNIRAL